MTILTDCPHCGQFARISIEVHLPDPSCHDPGMVEVTQVEGCSCWEPYFKPESEWDLSDALLADTDYYRECDSFALFLADEIFMVDDDA